METIVLRKKMFELGHVGSNFIKMQKNTTYRNKNKFIREFGWQKIMTSLYGEKFDSDDLKDSSLYKSYEKIKNDSIVENADFIKIYKLNEQFGVFLGKSIYLFHLIPKGNMYSDIIPWYCADGQVYIGDTWWEQDEEILGDIQSLSLIDFFEQYKGWCFSDKKLF